MKGGFLAAIIVAVTLSGCAEFAHYGAVGVEKRKTMNDLQARGTMAAVCDISLGSYFRELSDAEREYAALVCGGVTLGDGRPMALERFEVTEPPSIQDRPMSDFEARRQEWEELTREAR